MSKKIALVRATSVIPFDGIVHTPANSQHIKKDESSFTIEMHHYVGENVSDYMPYTSEYNSMSLWSLNSLVPDDPDLKNVFSDKPCAIIEDLDEQLKSGAEIISLAPTDTAIQGDVKLSKSSILLISKEMWESLSPEEKDKLSGLTVKVFEGDLKQAIKETLEERGYPSEDLTLKGESLHSADSRGFVQSETSQETLESIYEIANQNQVSMRLHLDMITDPIPSTKNEFNNMYTVQMIYKQTFFLYLFEKMPEIDNAIKSDCISNFDDPFTMINLCQEINRIGLDKYKKIVDEYNKAIESLKQNGQLPTPEELLTSFKEARQELRSKGIPYRKEDVVFQENLEHPVMLYDLVVGEINKSKERPVSMGKLCSQSVSSGTLSQSDIDSASHSIVIPNKQQSQGGES